MSDPYWILSSWIYHFFCCFVSVRSVADASEKDLVTLGFQVSNSEWELLNVLSDDTFSLKNMFSKL
jgi:hypothetical protein